MDNPYHREQQDTFSPPQRPLPNSTAILVLGILSIVFCFICGIVGLVLSSGDTRLYHQEPHIYTSSSFELVRAGRTCSIIGLCIWAALILFYIAFFAIAIGMNSIHD